VARACAEAYGLESALELQFETHYKRFLMPTIRGAEEGSKKRYAGLVTRADGSDEMVYKGLETVRTDWSPLARQFQQELYQRIFHRKPYQDYVRDYVRKTLAGEFDERWSTASACAAPSMTTNATCRRMRAARMADDYNARQGRPRQYQNGGWISYVITVAGPEPLEVRARHRLRPLRHPQLQPVADAILPFVDDDFSTLIGGQLGLF
jgi:DNA polymerase-2